MNGLFFTGRISLMGLIFITSIAFSNSQSITELSRDHMLDQDNKFGLIESDLDDWILMDYNVSRKGNIGHAYFQQTVQGIPVEGAIINITLNANGQIVNGNSRFIPNLLTQIKGSQVQTAHSALVKTLLSLGQNVGATITSQHTSNLPNQKTTFEIPQLSNEKLTAELAYLNMEKEGAVLQWKVIFHEISDFKVWEVFVNAQNGFITKTSDLVLNCSFGGSPHLSHDPSPSVDLSSKQELSGPAGVSELVVPNSYNVFAYPTESPNHGSRTLVINPSDSLASPFGWHDTNGSLGAEFTITRGNNVYAQEDRNGNGGTGFSPDGGANLEFDFPLNLALDPIDYDDASITNLFYWNNIIHDVMYQYGFDEASGNFQANNYGNGGSDNDHVVAEAQDGSDVDNARFFPSSDGNSPRMEMYLWTSPNPDRDGDFDHGIVSHEYGHGISIRLTGGRFETGCLNNAEQAGEGWSDFFGLYLTHESSDSSTTSRGVGTYALNQPLSGGGIRQYPYTTDITINPHTYDDIKSASIPHGIGSVMCVTLWDMYWNLIDVHGYDNDLYRGTGGNNIALQLVMEGFKLQPCSPGFLDVRDAILLADEMLYGGANVCHIWNAFAKRGMGVSATQGSTGSRSDGVEAFDTPPPLKVNSEPNMTMAGAGEIITFTITTDLPCSDQSNVVVKDIVPSGMTYIGGSASDGGVLSEDTIIWPTIPLLAKGTDLNYTFQAVMNTQLDTAQITFADSMENGIGNWTTANTTSLSDWIIASSPLGGQAWYAEELEATPLVSENQYLILSINLSPYSTLSFNHSYDTEVNWDGGNVEISEDGGITWTDLGDDFSLNGYNDYTRNDPSQVAFSGTSSGFIHSEVDLSAYCGNVQIRFNFYYDAFVNGVGWYVDDVTITSLTGETNTVMITSDEAGTHFDIDCILVSAAVLPVEWISIDAIGDPVGKRIEVLWSIASEINNKGFFVQRTFANNDFIDLSWVYPKEGNIGVKKYTYIDEEIIPNTTYAYRIRQVDHNGSLSYSIIVSESIKGVEEISVFPNPLNGYQTLVIDWSINNDGKFVKIEIMDSKGLVHYSEVVPSITDLLEMNLSNLLSGIYFIKIELEDRVVVKKLIIN